MFGQQPVQTSGGTKINVPKMIMVETGTFNPQYQRPYIPIGDNNIYNRLEEATQGGRNLQSHALAGLGHELLAPMGQIDHRTMGSDIDNGWGQNRLRFMMEIVVQREMSNMIERHILTGYTDYYDQSIGGKLPPDLKLYFNSSTCLRQFQNTINGIPTIGYHPTMMAQVLRGNIVPGMGVTGPVGGNTFSMLPAEMAQVCGTNSLMQEFNTPSYDTRCQFTDGAKLQYRDNNLSHQYLSRVLRGYSNVALNGDIDSASHGDLMDSLAGALREPMFSQMDGISALARLGHLRDPNGGYITYGELCRVDPLLDSTCTIIRQNTVQRTSTMGFAQAGDTQNWGGADPETLAAIMVSQTLPSIMSKLLLTRVTFRATNQTIDGQPTIDIEYRAPDPVSGAGATPTSFTDGLDITQYIQAFRERVQVELFPAISRNNSIPFNLVVDAQLLGDTVINIGLMGNMMTPFRSPTFADHLIAPVITNDYSHVVNMGNAMVAMAANVVDVSNSGMLTQTQQSGMSYGNFGNI